MVRDSQSRRQTDRRSGGRLYWLSRAEFALLFLAFLFYWFEPKWDALHFAHARVRGFVQEWSAQRLTRLSDWVETHRRLTEVRGELERKQAELEVTRSELRFLSLQIVENDALRSLFLLPRRPQYKYVYGEVVTRRIQNNEARLFVRIHSDDPHVRKTLVGSSVVAAAAPEWMAVGQVIKAHSDQAEIMLLSDPRSRIGVSSADTPAFGSALLVGAGQERMILDYAAHPHFLKKLSSGLKLVTTLGSQYPAGLVVARLQGDEESGESAAPLQPVPLLSYEELRFVVILVLIDVPGDPSGSSDGAPR